MICWNSVNACDGVFEGGADEHVGAVPPRAELDLVAVDQDEAAVMRQRAVRDDQVLGGGLAAAGLAAEQHVPLGQVDVDGSPYSSRPRCTGSNMENGKVGTGGSGRVSVAVMAGASLGVVGQAAPGCVPGTAVPVLGGGLALVGGVQRGDQLELVEVVVRGQALQGGGDEFAGREGVAADDVDGDQVGPAAVAGDPRVAGVAGGAQLAECGRGSPRRRCPRGTAPRRVPRPWSAGSTRSAGAARSGCAAGPRSTAAGAGAGPARTRTAG